MGERGQEGVRLGRGQVGCEQRIEVFVKIQKKKLGGGGGGGGQFMGGGAGGVSFLGEIFTKFHFNFFKGL